MPALVDGVELRDGVVVVAVLQIADLNLVDAVDFACGHAQFGADLGRRLRGPAGDRVQQQTRRVRHASRANVARLLAARGR